MHKLRTIILGALIPFTFSSSFANGVAGTPEWKSSFFTMEFSGFPVKKDMKNRPFPGESIYVVSDDVGDIAFTCLLEKLRTTIEIKSTDFESIVLGNNTSQRAKVRNLRFFINGKAVRSKNWTYVSELKVALSSKRSDALRIYNAAIRGDEVQVKMSGADKVRLNLPKPNSAFAQFGSECGIGTNK